MSAKKGNRNTAKWNNVTTLAKICMHARNGRSKTDCFRLVGVHPDTGWVWLKRGREGDNAEDGLLIRFERIFERAVAQFSSQQLKMIENTAQSGAPNTWQAAAWLLERRDPSNWGRRDTTTLQGGGSGGPVLQLNQVVLVDGDARDAARSLLRRVAGSGPDEPLGLGMGGESEEDAAPGPEPIVVDSR